jgi:hypothetical protein
MSAPELTAENQQAIEKLAHRMSHGIVAAMGEETGGQAAAAIMMVATHYLKQWAQDGQEALMLCRAADFLMDQAALYPVAMPK